MAGTFDYKASIANVRAVGRALAIYFFAQFEGETIPWPRVRAHDLGRACHCNTCAPNCSMCQAVRNPEPLVYTTHPTDPTNGPDRPPKRIA